MANQWYPLGISRFAKGEVDWESDTIKIVAVSSGYTYSDADEFLSDVGANTLGTATTISGCVVLDDGVLDASLVSYPGVLVGETVVGWVVYKFVTVAADSPLLFYMDTEDSGTLIDIDGNGADIPIVWSDSDDRIAVL